MAMLEPLGAASFQAIFYLAASIILYKSEVNTLGGECLQYALLDRLKNARVEHWD